MKPFGPFLLVFTILVSGLSFDILAQKEVSSKQIDKLFKTWDKTNSPGMGIGIISKGELIFAKGYGMANLEHDIPITPTSVFDIASLSKQFTGMAIGMLIQEGKISTEDDIRKYLPDFPEYGHTIKVDNLLHHTSGIRDWPTLLLAAGYQFDDVISFDHILSVIYSQKELNFIPGAEYVYSNSNYNLLVQIMEKVTGDSFDQWTKTNIFKPLGMSNTHFHINHQRLVPGKVDSYMPGIAGTYVNIANNLCAVGSSSLFTTVEDLSKWLINLGTGIVGGQKLIKLMTKRSRLNNGNSVKYGFGIEVSKFKGMDLWSHTGGWAGFRTFMAYFPEKEFGVIQLANLGSVSPTAKAIEIIDLYYSEEAEKNQPEKDKPKSDFDPFLRSEIEPEIFDDFVGAYELEAQPGFVLTFTRKGDNYFTQATGQQKFPIYSSSDSTFFLLVIEAYVTFHRDSDGQVRQITLHQNGHLKANRIKVSKEVFDPDPEELLKYTGKFSSEELGTYYVLEVLDEVLTLSHSRGLKLKLNPVHKDSFRAMGTGGEFKFETNESGDVTGFRLSMMPRTRNLWFKKVGDR